MNTWHHCALAGQWLSHWQCALDLGNETGGPRDLYATPAVNDNNTNNYVTNSMHSSINCSNQQAATSSSQASPSPPLFNHCSWAFARWCREYSRTSITVIGWCFYTWQVWAAATPAPQVFAINSIFFSILITQSPFLACLIPQPLLHTRQQLLVVIRRRKDVTGSEQRCSDIIASSLPQSHSCQSGAPLSHWQAQKTLQRCPITR